jgi:hypothetical protein
VRKTKTPSSRTFRDYFSAAKDSADIVKLYVYLSLAWVPTISLFMIDVLLDGPVGSVCGIAAAVAGAFALNYTVQCMRITWLLTNAFMVSIFTLSPEDGVNPDLTNSKPLWARILAWPFAALSTITMVTLMILFTAMIALGTVEKGLDLIEKAYTASKT